MLPNVPDHCRLSVFLARGAPVGVILRRGPTKWVQLIRWDRNTDSFELGQWFHGRVYGDRCDLSPNGRLFIYFATKYGTRRDDNDVGETWTAISRPPYFTALALWRNFSTWEGGGAFATDTDVLVDVFGDGDPHPKFQPQGLNCSYCHVDGGQRLQRDNWQLLERNFDPRSHRRTGDREIWEKPNANLGVKLCRQVEGTDFSEIFWLEAEGDILPLSDVSWADWDNDRQIVFVRQGRLYRADIDALKLHEAELYDFNPLQPQNVTTPDWAQHW